MPALGRLRLLEAKRTPRLIGSADCSQDVAVLQRLDEWQQLYATATPMAPATYRKPYAKRRIVIADPDVALRSMVRPQKIAFNGYYSLYAKIFSTRQPGIAISRKTQNPDPSANRKLCGFISATGKAGRIWKNARSPVGRPVFKTGGEPPWSLVG